MGLTLANGYAPRSMNLLATLNDLSDRRLSMARQAYGRARKRAWVGLGQVRIRYLPSVYPPDMLTTRLARDARVPQDASLRAVLRENVKAHGIDLVELRIGQAIHRLYSKDRITAAGRLLRAGISILADSEPLRALHLGDAHIHACPRPKTVHTFVQLQSRLGNISRALELFELYIPEQRDTKLGQKVVAESKLLARGMPRSSQRALTPPPTASRRILYHVSQCPPHHSSGYAIRTHSLAKQLLRRGWEIDVFARHGYPNDRYDFLHRDLAQTEELLDSLRYHFQPDRDGFRILTPQDYQLQATRTLRKQATAFHPALIHTASNQVVGLAGTEAALELGIPSIYEMRGLWHMTRASKEPNYARSEHYAMTHALEMQAAMQADHVLTITEAIRDIAIAGGVSDENITVIPNAVNVDEFIPAEPYVPLRKELGFNDDDSIIGFVGSFAAYEGLDDLLRAAAKLRIDGYSKFRLLLVGDGAAMETLIALTDELGLQSIVTFTGRVPHSEVARYYSLMHICAYPRKGARVCEVVSPLKPLEAMAMEKAVIVSSVQALAEMVRDQRTGLIHVTDDWRSLASCLGVLLENENLRQQLGSEARRWVQEHRTWERVAQRVEGVYEQLIANGTTA